MSSLVFPSNLAGLDIKVKRAPVWATKVQPSASGKELRAAWQSYPRWKYSLQINFLRQAGFSANTSYDEAATLEQFFQSIQGEFDTFLFSDPYGNTVTAGGFGVGDGSTTAFQLQRATRGPLQVNGWDATRYTLPTTPRTNLAKYSQQLNTAPWAYVNASVSPDVAVAPDGTPTADKVVESVATGAHTAYQTITVIPSTTYTMTVYAKAAERTWLRMLEGNTLTANAFFNLSTGTLGTVNGTGNPVATITPIGNGWYRCTLTITTGAAQTSANLQFGPATADNTTSYSGDGLSGLYAWGAQFETGASGTPAITTTAAAVTVTPNYYPKGGDGFEPVQNLDYSTAPLQVWRNDWQGNQLMYQTARTNLVATQDTSGQLNTATVSASPVTDPKGTTTANRLTNSSGTNPYWAKPFTPAVAGTHTFTLWLMGGTSTTSSIGIFDTTITTAQVYVSSAVLSGPGSVVQSGNTINVSGLVAGSWTRIQLTVSGLAAGTTYKALVYAHTAGSAADTNYIEVFGWQAEYGSTATSWIATSGATVTLNDYTVNGSGLVTFAVAPVTGAVLTASFAYFIRVRFNRDALDMERMLGKVWDGKTVEFISTK